MAATPDLNVGALEERVTGLERTVGHVSTTVDRLSTQVSQIAPIVPAVEALARKLDERSRFPWGVVFGGLSVLITSAGIGMGIVIWAFSAYISGQYDALNRLNGEIETLDTNSVTRHELEERREATNQRITRLEADVSEIEDGIVPRGEHEEHWRSQEQRVVELQRQIDQIRTDLGSSYSLNDALTTLQERIDRLEQLRLSASTP